MDCNVSQANTLMRKNECDWSTFSGWFTGRLKDPFQSRGDCCTIAVNYSFQLQHGMERISGDIIPKYIMKSPIRNMFTFIK